VEVFLDYQQSIFFEGKQLTLTLQKERKSLGGRYGKIRRMMSSAMAIVSWEIG
jgi:hypothetical protein